MSFRTGETEGEPTFIWRDIEGDATEFYEFVARGTNEPTRAFFETCMYRAMFERKYRTTADSTQDKDLAEFIWQCVSFLIQRHAATDPLLLRVDPHLPRKGRVKEKITRN